MPRDNFQRDTRVALVIGNARYSVAAPLRNPPNDARAISAVLSKLGFDVFSGIDLGRDEMEDIFSEFDSRISNAEVALFFYAGHGLQVRGENFLIPTDARIEQEVHLRRRTFPLNELLTAMARRAEISIVILDACRDNPFSRSLLSGMSNVGSARSLVRSGLAEVKAQGSSFIAFATAPDNVADDGRGINSPFTEALLNVIETPGMSISDMMIDVRQQVYRATEGRQEPWDQSSLRARFYFSPAIEPEMLPTPHPVPEPPQPLHQPPRRSLHLRLKPILIPGVALLLASAGIFIGPKVWTSVKETPQSQPVGDIPKTPIINTSPPPKAAERVGQPNASSQIASMAQKVVLYDEDPAVQVGRRYEGTVVWRTDQIAGAAGKPPDLAIRADVDVPDRKLKMTLTIRRNNDASLPASHTVELTFTLPPDFNGGGVANVPGMLLKSAEQTKGTPLAGLAVKVNDGFFLMGLSNVDADKSRNIQLLKERSWFDIPLVYTNQRRAILAIEKGPPGERAFKDAFAAWGQ